MPINRRPGYRFVQRVICHYTKLALRTFIRRIRIGCFSYGRGNGHMVPIGIGRGAVDIRSERI